jgi:hypothetical protein
VRFGLDFLRTADVRYLGITPGQYASIALLLGCLWLLLRKPTPVPEAPKAQGRAARKA